MNYDLALCNGESDSQTCLLRDGCYRYILHKDYRANEEAVRRMSVPYMEATECLGKGNHRYIDERTMNNGKE